MTPNFAAASVCIFNSPAQLACAATLTQPKPCPHTRPHNTQAWWARWRIWIGCALLSALASTAQATPRCHIVVVGDSLSAAYGLPQQQGWVALLKQRLQQNKLDCSVHNASISGDTTAGGLARLPTLLATQKPTHMVLELGGNDGLRGLPIAQMKSNLNRMVVLANQNKVRTVLVGMRIPPNYGPQYTRAFEDTFAQVAKTHRLNWVPFLLEGFANNPSAFQDDGIHPNASAQAQMLNTVWPALLKSLQAHFKA